MNANENFNEYVNEDTIRERLEQIVSDYQFDYVGQTIDSESSLKGEVIRSRRHLKRCIQRVVR